MVECQNIQLTPVNGRTVRLIGDFLYALLARQMDVCPLLRLIFVWPLHDK